MAEQSVDILLADDSESDTELASRALRVKDEGWSVQTVRDGVEALAFVFGAGDVSDSELAHKPRLVLLDLKMPRMDGFQVLERLKSDPRTRNIPVVVLTSSPEQKDMARCTQLGANDYKVKPMTFDFYTRMVQEIAHRWLEEGPSSG